MAASEAPASVSITLKKAKPAKPGRGESLAFVDVAESFCCSLFFGRKTSCMLSIGCAVDRSQVSVTS